jgi:hypothetical protein
MRSLFEKTGKTSELALFFKIIWDHLYDFVLFCIILACIWNILFGIYYLEYIIWNILFGIYIKKIEILTLCMFH